MFPSAFSVFFVERFFYIQRTFVTRRHFTIAASNFCGILRVFFLWRDDYSSLVAFTGDLLQLPPECDSPLAYFVILYGNVARAHALMFQI